MTETPRYALYFAPAAESPLWIFGSGVLGYDAAAGVDAPRLAIPGLDAALQTAITADPRVYGFHATLKAPFSLREGVSEAGLLEEVRAFARRTPRARMDGLAPTLVGGRFVALTPLGDPTAVNALAAAAVTSFEPLRAPLTPGDLARRRPERMSQRQREYLDRFGYHLVLEEFRFHMTLTNALAPTEAPAILDAVAELFAAHVPAGPVTVDRLAIYRQRTRAERFTVLGSVALV